MVTLWCAPTPSNLCPYEVSTSYNLRFPWYRPDKILKGQGYNSKIKGQIKVTPWHYISTTPNQGPQQTSTFYTLEVPRYNPDNILKVKVTMAKSTANQGQVIILHAYTPQPRPHQV